MPGPRFEPSTAVTRATLAKAAGILVFALIIIQFAIQRRHVTDQQALAALAGLNHCSRVAAADGRLEPAYELAADPGAEADDVGIGAEQRRTRARGSRCLSLSRTPVPPCSWACGS